MNLKEYMDLVTDNWEFTCWDTVIDSEFYLYKKDEDDEPDPDFPNLEKLMDYLKENLEIKEIQANGVTVGLYELLDHPAIITYAKENLYEPYQYSSNDDVVELMFHDMLVNISDGYENLSGKMLEAFHLAYPEKKEIEQITAADISNLQPLNELSVSMEMKAATSKENNISVETPLGDIVVQVKTDSEYPGVFIDLKGDKVNDTFEVGTVMLSTVEYDPLKKAVQTVVYGDAQIDAPTHIVAHENVEKNIETEVYRLVDIATMNDIKLDMESTEYKKAIALLEELCSRDFPELHDSLFENSDMDLIFADKYGDFKVFYYNPDSNAGGQIVEGEFQERDISRFLEGEELIEVIADYTQYLSDINTYHFFNTAFQILDLKEKGFFLGTDIETISKDFLKKNELDTKSLDEKLNGIKKDTPSITVNKEDVTCFSEVDINNTPKNIENNLER